MVESKKRGGKFDKTEKGQLEQSKNGIHEKYKIEKTVGNGTFGVVYKALNSETNKIVAIKKVFQDPRYKNRELSIIKMLNHPNCIKLKESYYSEGKTKEEVYLNLVTNYISTPLSKLIYHYHQQNGSFPQILVKLYSYQMLRALAYLQGLGICHRDIKPSNMLVDTNSHKVKVCDFGSAKALVATEPNIAYISSRYYRSPELILGYLITWQWGEYYNINKFLLGCVIAEMIIGSPVFPGTSATDQMTEIIKVVGTPTQEEIKAMNANYKATKPFPSVKQTPWDKLFKGKADFLAADFVSKLLQYDPKKRINPMEALLHPFFMDIKNQNCKINNKQLPKLFNFTKGLENIVCQYLQCIFSEELFIFPDKQDKLIPLWAIQETKK